MCGLNPMAAAGTCLRVSVVCPAIDSARQRTAHVATARLCALHGGGESGYVLLLRRPRAPRYMRVLRYDVNKDDKVSFEEIVAADHELRKEVQL